MAITTEAEMNQTNNKNNEITIYHKDIQAQSATNNIQYISQKKTAV